MVRTNKNASREQLMEWGLLKNSDDRQNDSESNSQQSEQSASVNTFETDESTREDVDTDYNVHDLVELEELFCESQNIADLIVDSEDEEGNAVEESPKRRKSPRKKQPIKKC